MKAKRPIIPYGSKIHLRSKISRFTFSTLFDIHQSMVERFSNRDGFNINTARTIATDVVNIINHKRLMMEQKSKEDGMEKESEINFNVPASIKSRIIREMLNDQIINEIINSSDEFLYGTKDDLRGILHTCVFFSLLNIADQCVSTAFTTDSRIPPGIFASIDIPTYMMRFNYSDIGLFFNWEVSPVIEKNGLKSKTREKYVFTVIEGDGITGPLYQPNDTPGYKYSPIEFWVDINENERMLKGVLQSRAHGFSIVDNRDNAYITIY